MAEHHSSRLIIGCGYLGSRVARRWLAAGDRVFALTRSAQRAQEFRQVGLEPIVADVLIPESLTSLPPAQTLLYSVGYDRHSGVDKRTVYVTGLRNTLQAISSLVERVIYISSTSVYGQSNGEWVDEHSDCTPSTEGGRICLEAEELLQEQLPAHVPRHVLRLSGLYGPGRLLARINELRENRPITGNPEKWLNLVHVDDAASIVDCCAASISSPHEKLLVSDDRPVRRRTYYETLARLVDAPPPSISNADGPFLDLGKRCDNSRLHGIMRNLRFATIDEGLPHAVRSMDV